MKFSDMDEFGYDLFKLRSDPDGIHVCCNLIQPEDANLDFNALKRRLLELKAHYPEIAVTINYQQQPEDNDTLKTFDTLSKHLLKFKSLHEEIHTFVNAVHPNDLEVMQPWFDTCEKLNREIRKLLHHLDTRFNNAKEDTP